MSKIEWTEQTWNPIAGCSIVSPGCTNCYAMRMAARLEAMANVGLRDTSPLSHYRGLTKPSKAGPVWTGKLALAPDHTLTAPLRRKKPTMFFVNSMSDLFHEDVPDAWIDRVFAVMALSPQHTFQVLTKRAVRMRAYLSRGDVHQAWIETPEWRDAEDRTVNDDADGKPNSYHMATARLEDAIIDFMARPNGGPLPNVWLGVSCEDQRRADERIPDLLATPAAVRFVSAEPLLGPIDFTSMERKSGEGLMRPLDGRFRTIDWIIVGGESGPSARPMALGWAEDIVRQCQSAHVPVFVKQLGANPVNSEGGRCQHITHPKGADLSEWPVDLRVRAMPGITNATEAA